MLAFCLGPLSGEKSVPLTLEGDRACPAIPAPLCPARELCSPTHSYQGTLSCLPWPARAPARSRCSSTEPRKLRCPSPVDPGTAVDHSSLVTAPRRHSPLLIRRGLVYRAGAMISPLRHRQLLPSCHATRRQGRGVGEEGGVRCGRFGLSVWSCARCRLRVPPGGLVRGRIESYCRTDTDRGPETARCRCTSLQPSSRTDTFPSR